MTLKWGEAGRTDFALNWDVKMKSWVRGHEGTRSAHSLGGMQYRVIWGNLIIFSLHPQHWTYFVLESPHCCNCGAVFKSKAIQCHSHRNPIHTHDECGVTAGVRIRGAGQTVKRQMVTYRITAFGKDLAGFGQVGKGWGNLSPLATYLHRSQASGERVDLNFTTWLAPAQDGGKWENL